MESLCNKVRLGNEFFITTGGKPFKRNAFEYAFQTIRGIIDVSDSGYPHARIYDFRHTYATVLKEKEISLKAISVCLGHNGAEITENVYINLPKEEVVCECEKEVTDFVHDILPKRNHVLDIAASDNVMYSYFPKDSLSSKRYA